MQQLIASGNPANCLPNIPNNGNFTSDIGTILCNGMQSNFNGTPVSCFGFCDGDLVAVSSLGIALDYAWSNGFNDLNNASGASGISGLCAGNYSVTITATGGGCVTELSTTVNQPTQQQLGQPTINPMGCLDDSTWVYFPGNPPFTFQWSNGAVNDSVYLPVGTYTVSVTGGGPCGVLPATFTVSNSAISVSVLTANVSCNGLNDGCITATAMGGISPYLYSINGIAWQASNVFCNLTPGTYTVAAIDANTCTGSTVVAITQPTAISIFTLINNNVTCKGGTDGSVTVNASAGIPPYQYSLDGGITFQTDSLFDTLTAGNYTVVVQDANGCNGSAGTSVTEPPSLVASFGTDVTVCSGSSVNLCANAFGGSGAYTYWTNVGTIIPCLVVNVSGLYIINVVDTYGCIASDTVVVTYSSSLDFLSLQVDSLPDCGVCNGKARLDE